METLGARHPWDWNCSLATLSEATRLIEAAGFDFTRYRDAHPDLQRALRGSGSALFHFLFYGCHEQRSLPIDLQVPPLSAFQRLALGDQGYRTTVIAALAAAYLRDAEGHCDDWIARKWPVICALRDVGARPFIITGSSAMDIYNRFSTRTEDWSLPLPLRFGGRSAIGLNRPGSTHGHRFRAFIAMLDSLPHTETLPILCKFGGTEMDYLYHMQRIIDGNWRFDAAHFDSYCARSVAAYLEFLCDVFPAPRRRFVDIVSISPPAVRAEHWVDAFVRMLGYGRVPHEQLPDWRTRARRLEMPSQLERTGFHARYNALLQAGASQHGFAHVEDFPLFLADDGLVDPGFVPHSRGTDDHFDRHAVSGIVAPLLWDRIDAKRPGQGRRRTRA
jgi:hypothetical protein